MVISGKMFSRDPDIKFIWIVEGALWQEQQGVEGFSYVCG